MAKGAKLKSGWEPSEDDREYGHQLNLSDYQIDSMAEDMRLWAGAKSNRPVARKANWSLTFKGWMRRGAEKVNRNGYERAGQNRPTTNGRQQTSHADSVLTGMGRVAARYATTDSATGPQDGPMERDLFTPLKPVADR